MSGRFGEGPELRVDGSRVAARRPRFFVARADGLWTGDAAQITRDDRPGQPASSAAAGPLQQLFAGFEAERRASEAQALEDDTTREALRALGYAD